MVALLLNKKLLRAYTKYLAKIGTEIGEEIAEEIMSKNGEEL